jgi:IS1 family transposase/transposase-like protein
MNEIICPKCGSGHCKKNGHIHNGKQNYRCKGCGSQFVLNKEQKIISEQVRSLILKALLERNSLRGICRIFSVSLTWLLKYITEIYGKLPPDLNVKSPTVTNDSAIVFYSLEIEADEMWSFVGKKSNKQWIWIAIDAKTRQVVAFHVGKRDKEAARELWQKIPKQYRQKAIFYTDLYESYQGVIPDDQHQPVTKKSGLTNHIERFNCTLRQRVSRLVRDSLAFSKKIDKHIGAIAYFICHYNQTKNPRALHV